MSPERPKRAAILLNLGTPDDPTPAAVGRYLREFLMDPYVVDIPAPLRWFLVNVLIVPRRKHTSAEAYAKVWSPTDGSPLRSELDRLTAGVRQALGESSGIAVAQAMRYGKPSIEAALREVAHAGLERLFVLPLYPQYSTAATESSVVETRRLARELGLAIEPEFLPAFYEQPDFIESFAKVIRRSLAERPVDHVIFSYHGLPERQIRRLDRAGTHCLASPDCCARITAANTDCYRAQCYATTRALVRTLGLAEGGYSVGFQSRLGRTPWIQPFSDHLYSELPKRGIRKVAVVCPSFVADCLETLEEVALRGRDQFVAAGGEQLHLVPSLNAETHWATAVAGWIRHHF